MGLKDGLRRWYELNARLFGALYRVADIVAGIAFLAVVVLGASVVEAATAVSIPVVPEATREIALAMYGAIGVFAVAVLVQTLAGLRSFFSRLFARVLE